MDSFKKDAGQRMNRMAAQMKADLAKNFQVIPEASFTRDRTITTLIIQHNSSNGAYSIDKKAKAIVPILA